MSEGPTAMPGLPDPAERMAALQRIAERSRKVAELWLGGSGKGAPALPASLAHDFMEAASRLMLQPDKLVQAHAQLWQDYMRLWQGTTLRMLGQEAPAVAEPAKDDRRFKSDAWQDPVFDMIKQGYLLSARCLQTTMRGVDGLDEAKQKRVDFYTRQLVDAIAPTNFALTNPDVLRATAETGGENLLRGFENLLEDLESGGGQLQVKMADKEAFELGRNVASTPGKVVFQNELIQLIQYAPTTKEVHSRPLLIMPPWINKFYILDLQPKNSFIKWAVDQGNTVFVVSWVNPDERHRHLTWDDYMELGPLAALGAMEQATGERQANVIGYCIGGTLLAATLGYMAATGDDRVASATFFTSIMDFQDAGELTLFTDEQQIADMERQMEEKGYLDATTMAQTFNLMRANDLIWSFVVNNYLMGKEPVPFDLLHWNADSTRMPAEVHRFYLRNMYQKNLLKEPGGISLKGVPIDLRQVQTPVFYLSAREDHIAPWPNTYAATQRYGGPKRFVLAGSGHIAGVVNPAGSTKYGYWTNGNLPADPEAWLAGAAQHPGSWWPHWAEWLSQHAGGKAKARVPGRTGSLKAIEDAPGSYVKARS
jgi:polyhydroxyalkanoate synthase